MPPIHALAPSTCRTLAGSSTATGSWTPACPPRPGSSASRPSGTAASSGRRAQRERAGGDPGDRARRPDRPEARPSTSSADPSADQNVLPCAVAAWRPMATTPLATPAPAAISSSAPRPRVERRGGRRRCARGAQRRAPGQQQHREQAEAERDRAVLHAARGREGDGGDGPGLLVAEQLGDAGGRRRGVLADGEDEAAADRVRVGRDDLVGDGVAAVGEPVPQPHGDRGGRRRRDGTRRPAAPRAPSASWTRTAPSASSTGSEKRSSTWPGAVSSAVPRGGHGRLQRRVRARGRGRDGEQREARARAPASPGLTGAGVAAAADQRTPRGRRGSARPRARRSPRSGSPPPGVGVQVSVPLIAPGRPPTRHRHRPSRRPSSARRGP